MLALIKPDVRLLQISRPTLDMRTSKGEVVYAFGNPLPATRGEYLVLDAFAVLEASMLLPQLGHKAAAAMMGETSDLWLGLLQMADDPACYAAEPLPPDKRLYLFFGAKGDGSSKYAAGLPPLTYAAIGCRLLSLIRSVYRRCFGQGRAPRRRRSGEFARRCPALVEAGKVLPQFQTVEIFGNMTLA